MRHDISAFRVDIDHTKYEQKGRLSPMKKMIATVAALTLTLAMSVTVSAAPSVTNPSTQGTTQNWGTTNSSATTTIGSVTYLRYYEPVQAAAKDANGNEVTVTITQLTAEQKAEAREEVEAVFGGNVDVFAAADYDVAGASESNPITVVFETAGVHAGDAVYVLHKHSSDGKWYKEGATATEGKVTAVFTSFSPMVIVRDHTVAASGEQHYHHFDDNVVAPTATTWGYTIHSCECGYSYVDSYVAPLDGASAAASPKTGDNGVAGLVLAAAACMGALICVKRKKIA